MIQTIHEKMGAFDLFWIKGAKKKFAPYPRDERRLHQWWWYPRSPWMGLQQLCKTQHKQRTHTHSLKRWISEKGEKRIKLRISHTPHNLSISPLGLCGRYLAALYPPSQIPLHFYPSHIRSQGLKSYPHPRVCSYPKSKTKYLNLGKRPQSECFF